RSLSPHPLASRLAFASTGRSPASAFRTSKWPNWPLDMAKPLVPHIRTMIGTTQAVSGLDLRVERVKRELRGIDVALRMGLSSQRVYQIEQMRRVPPELVTRYMDALDQS